MISATATILIALVVQLQSGVARAEDPWSHSPAALFNEPLTPATPLPPPSAECMKLEAYYGFKGDSAEYDCRRIPQDLVAPFKSPSFSDCVLTQWSEGGGIGYAIQDCTEPSRLSAYENGPLHDCARELKALGFSSGAACSSKASKASALLSAIANPTQKACISYAVSALYGYFLWDDRVAAATAGASASAEERILSDCAKSPYLPEPPQSPLRFMQDLHFHTQQTFLSLDKKRNFFVGGLSGLAYDPATNRLHSETDDKTNPYILTFDLRLNPGFSRPMSITPSYLTPIAKPDAKHPKWFDQQDWEDIALLPNGDFLLSSEVDSIDVFTVHDDFHDDDDLFSFFGSSHSTDPKDIKPETPRLVSRYSSNGKWRESYVISEALTPAQTYETEAPAAKPVPTPAPSTGAGLGPLGDKYDDYLKHDAYTEPFPIKIAHPSAGIKPNKGLEAMTLSIDGKKLYTGVEAPLYQDIKPEVTHTTRIFEQAVSGTDIKPADYFYWYVLENEPDNGLSALKSLADGSLLSLERSYDFATGKLKIRIFHVTLQKAPPRYSGGGQARKELVLDLDDIIPSLSAGFHKLENFEGMTIGPKMPNGNPTLILVSDNNFNPAQRTTFLVFEITGLKESL